VRPVELALLAEVRLEANEGPFPFLRVSAVSACSLSRNLKEGRQYDRPNRSWRIRAPCNGREIYAPTVRYRSR
jgi:hypothetical protein